MRLRLAGLISCIFLFAGSFAMQGQARSDSRRGRLPEFELYGGYSYMFRNYNPASTTVATTGTNGWDASFKFPVLGSFLGVEGDVSGSYLDDRGGLNLNPKTYFFLVGPHVSVHLGRSTLFAHAMVGTSHVTQNAILLLRSDSSVAIAAGGGLDAGISPTLAWRVEGDYFDTNYQLSSDLLAIRNSNGRISTGPVFRF